jgi:hypothetical protein
MNRDDIPRLSQAGGLLNGADRGGLCARVGVVAADGDVKLSGMNNGGECGG